MGSRCAGHPCSTPRVLASDLEEGVLRAVAYADVFDFPLLPAEIHRFLVGVPASRDRIRACLAGMAPGLLEERGGFYFLPGRRELAELRRRRAEASARLWPLARHYARRIASLPFVRMVAVTGSLARNNVEGAGDVDYFLVAEPERVWTCRAFVGLLTRWARTRGVVLCANYYLSEASLALRERDLYTAHEVVQMVPLSGPEAYRRFRRENRWVRALLPNAPGSVLRAGISSNGGEPSFPDLLLPPGAFPPEVEPGNGTGLGPRLRGAASRAAERALRTPVGGWLDRVERVRKREKALREEEDLTEARFDPHRFKGHFDGHRARILAAYQERLRTLGLEAR